ncbi:isovaleryl-CoA dehydrogenase [Arenimonas daejeonensis]|uniref:isovaleryl-CoA dehydrogenase n=1 Tax=Arenimonas daejeonensis TaxID=370777 RepID=UPI0011BD9B81|nr:isovaleryl-CoA dehydrogenase [Arenimonas daejeonensis]
MDLRERFLTHAVENQPPALAPYDAWNTDLPLREALAREGGGWAEAQVAEYGKFAGGELVELGRLANEHRPRFVPVDRYGHRLDEVEFHPAYHRLMATAVRHGVPGFAWRHADRPGAHVARAALMFLHNQADQGTSCPLTMTYACVPALRHQPELAASWLPRIVAPDYDPRHVPAWDKVGNTIGMGMTEKQGGSDVRANTTRAFPVATAGPGQLYELVGHKWFFSAPMCDAFLVLAAQAAGGLSCFLLPRFAPDGSRNAIRIQRLKDKLGDWSNASSEVEFHGATAWLVGEEGRGVATILQMVALTRQDCLIGSASLMRQALVQALHHARHRSAFGKPLLQQPLMRNVLADLALESEAATALTFRVARAVDASVRDPREAAFARLATALGKYWVCKRAPAFVNEAQECLGGAGYVEESGLPRLYRQAPLNSIWEGSGNIQCLDLLRALGREPASAEAYFAELEAARGGHALLDTEIPRLRAQLQAEPAVLEAGARRLAERLALALQAALLVRSGHAALANTFCEQRLGSERALVYGGLSGAAAVATLIERAGP